MDNENVAMILGDNIFEDDLSEDIRSFEKGGRVFAKEVVDPERFGVVTFDEKGKVVSLEEKPAKPKSNYAIPGLYIFDNRASKFAKDVKPSARGELEIIDLHKRYLELGELDVRTIEGQWIDAGTFDSLFRANILAKEKLQDKLII